MADMRSQKQLGMWGSHGKTIRKTIGKWWLFIGFDGSLWDFHEIIWDNMETYGDLMGFDGNSTGSARRVLFFVHRISPTKVNEPVSVTMYQPLDEHHKPIKNHQ